jgi:hypothetical protein
LPPIPPLLPSADDRPTILRRSAAANRRGVEEAAAGSGDNAIRRAVGFGGSSVYT